jgi:hypothetical protein
MDDTNSQRDLGGVAGSGPPGVCVTAEAGDFTVIAHLGSEGATTPNDPPVPPPPAAEFISHPMAPTLSWITWDRVLPRLTASLAYL